MISVADYIIDFLVKKGVKDVFMVAGGGIMYLIDSVGRNKKINYIANHHEQASATAAESYSRVTNNIGVCLVTTGPGGTNAITGVAGAWVDSIPMLVISGQVKRELIADYKNVRQVGPQEINIVGMVKGITKYAKTIMDPNTIRYELEKAFYEAKNGRPGPAWLDIPLDVQGSMVDEKKLVGFTAPKVEKDKTLNKKIDKVISLLKKSKRPVIIAGNGIRLSGAVNKFREMVNKLNIPVLLTMNGMDLVPEQNRLLVGKFGPVGQRRGNFVLQNADLIIAMGASLNVSSTGFSYSDFGRNAKKILVNIDGNELKVKKFKVEMPLKCDVKDFIDGILEKINDIETDKREKWLCVCDLWKEKYRNIIPDFFKDEAYVNSYVFFDRLSQFLDRDTCVVTGIALDACGLYQSFSVKDGQRAFVNKNFGQMGWDLPAVIGACLANGKKKTILVAGDGSIQLNIQELQTIHCYNLPIKIFIFNNHGYESIRATQDNLFCGRRVGACEKSGVTNPNFKLLAKAHGFNFVYIKTNNELDKKIKSVLNTESLVICEINIAFDQKRVPKASTYRLANGTLVSKPLEDMAPFLPEKEVWENMHLCEE